MQLEITHLTKSFGSHHALSDLSLQVDQAHALVLIGPSGCGKTTLLRIVAGLEIPDAGSVTLNKQSLPVDERGLRQYRQTIGTVFQAFNLFPHLTALRNLTLPLEKVHGYPLSEARELAMTYLRRFQLEAHAFKTPAELSGGQRQRVAIARAVAIKPKVLLFDEPTSALDPEMTAEVLDLIAELRAEGRDLMLVTHNLGFAKVVADQVAFIAEGQIVETGTADQIFNHPQSAPCQQFLEKVLKY